jgi:hypothetical protein
MTYINEKLRTFQEQHFPKPMSREQVIRVNTALLVFGLSSLFGTVFWGGQIFEKLTRIESEVQKLDRLYERVTIIEQKVHAFSNTN